jgi:integrase/recombinase XerD
MKTSFSHLVTSFFNVHLKMERGLSPNTIASYSDALRLLFDYICQQAHIPIEKLEIGYITQKLVLDFLASREEEQDNSVSSRNQRLAAIKAFCHFLAGQAPEFMHVNASIHAISAKKTDYKPPPSMTEEEVWAIINTPDPATLMGACDRAMLLMLYNTGARVQEIADLKITSVHDNPKAPTVTIVGKGRKQRETPLWPETVAAINHYLKLRESMNIQSPHLFLSIRAEPLTRFGIGRRIEQFAKKAAEKCPSLVGRRITPHTFRHTTALHLIEKGVDITIIKEWLGHADIKTTSQYIEVNLQRKRQALDKFKAPGTADVVEHPTWKNPTVMAFLKGLSQPQKANIMSKTAD